MSTKSKAPSPPGLKQLDPPGFSQWYPGNPHLTMDHKENAMDRDLSLLVVLPDGVEKMTTVHGRYGSTADPRDRFLNQKTIQVGKRSFELTALKVLNYSPVHTCWQKLT